MSEILDDDFLLEEKMFGKNKVLVVGISEMKSLIINTRKSYPEIHFEMMEFGKCGMNSLFVHWDGWAVNLGKFHGHDPTGHYSTINGICLFNFNQDKTKIKKVIKN